jgi:hypothetical protein
MLVGCGLEACLAATLATSAFGPCGPGNVIGLLALIGHIPGMLLLLAFRQAAHVSDSLDAGIMVVAQAALFSALAWWVSMQRRGPG